MDDSPLNRLPAELRNRIYELVFDKHDVIPTVPLRKLSKYNGLTRTCRQIRKETHGMFFALNKFELKLTFTKGPKYIPRLCTLLRTLGRDTVCQIPELIINTWCWDPKLIFVNGPGTEKSVGRWSRLI